MLPTRIIKHKYINKTCLFLLSAYNSDRIYVCNEYHEIMCYNHTVVCLFTSYLCRNTIYSKCLLCLVDLLVSCCSSCAFLHGPFCHGALKLDLSTVFTTFFRFEHLFNLTFHYFELETLVRG